MKIEVKASRAGRDWTGSFSHRGEKFRVGARTYNALKMQAITALEASSASVDEVTVVSPYEDAVIGANQAVKEAEAAARTAQEIRRSLVRKMKHDGLSHSDIAAILDISHQRVSQLLGRSGSGKEQE